MVGIYSDYWKWGGDDYAAGVLRNRGQTPALIDRWVSSIHWPNDSIFHWCVFVQRGNGLHAIDGFYFRLDWCCYLYDSTL